MSKPEFVYVTYIETTARETWHALTDKEFTPKYWMDCTLTSDWKVGSRMHMDRSGRVMNECVRPRIRSAEKIVLQLAFGF